MGTQGTTASPGQHQLLASSPGEGNMLRGKPRTSQLPAGRSISQARYHPHPMTVDPSGHLGRDSCHYGPEGCSHKNSVGKAADQFPKMRGTVESRWSLAVMPKLFDPPKGPIPKKKPLEEEVEPLGEEADAYHHDAHQRGIVGHGVENRKRLWSVPER